MTQLVVTDRAHAKISPSMFERAEKCPASVKLSQGLPARLAGPAAAFGTAAHALLEHCLSQGLDTFELGDLKTVQVDGAGIQIDEEMLDGLQVALDWVRANIPEPRLIERQVKLPFTAAHGPVMSGWIDVASALPPWIVADLKTGYHRVEADAIQLALYLLGLALETNPTLEGQGEHLAGTTVVIQPKEAEAIRVHRYSWGDLRAIQTRVSTALRRLQEPGYQYALGDWCRFCPAAGICPHLAAVATDPAMTQLVPTPELVANGTITAAKLDTWLLMIPILDHWAKQVAAVAEDYLIHGGKLANHKLVRKRTNRAWKNEREAAYLLGNLDVNPYMPPKVVSPAEAERRLPAIQRKLIAPLIEKPAGELTLAAVTDSREPVDVHETLRNALQSSVAQGYLTSAKPSA